MICQENKKIMNEGDVGGIPFFWAHHRSFYTVTMHFIMGIARRIIQFLFERYDAYMS